MVTFASGSTAHIYQYVQVFYHMKNYNINSTFDQSYYIHKLAIYSFVGCIFAAFFQPTLIRYFGLPLYPLFTTLFVLFATYLAIKKSILSFSIVSLIFLVYFFLGFNPSKRFILLFYFLIMVYVSYSLSDAISEEWQRIFPSVLLTASLIISIVGVFRFVYGFQVPGSENYFGMSQLRAYPYLGIQYLNSTRNADSLIFSMLFIVGIHYYLRENQKKITTCLAFFVTVVGGVLIILTLSRLMTLVFIITLFYLFYYSWKKGLACIFLVLISVLLISQFHVKNQIKLLPENQIIKKVESLSYLTNNIIPSFFMYDLIFVPPVNSSMNYIEILQPKSPPKDESNNIKYSNKARIDLYKESIESIFNNILGLGFDNVSKSINSIQNLDYIHSENIHLDLFSAYGVFYLPFFLMFIVVCVKYFLLGLTNRKYIIPSLSIITLGGFSMLNSPINLPIFWVLISSNIMFYKVKLKNLSV
jgi:hypothetical protein